MTTQEAMLLKLAELEDLPTLPAVVQKILFATNDPQAGARDLTALMRNDQALSARVLKVSNSAFYGLRSKVATIDRAVSVIGFDEVRRIALTALVAKSFPDRAGIASFPLDRFWIHSAAVAWGAKDLLAKSEVPPDEAFTTGLLHDIGKLIVCQYYPKHFFLIVHYVQSLSLDTVEVEMEILGVTHGQVGAGLAGIWGLPPIYLKVMTGHHLETPRGAVGDPSDLLVAAVRVADAAARRQRIGVSGSMKIPEWPRGAANLLDLSEQDLKSFEARLGAHRNTFENYFN